MEKQLISNLLQIGSSVILPSMPFSVIELRNLAKDALLSSATLTIVVENNLTPKDIEIIISEAPTNITLDFSRCRF